MKALITISTLAIVYLLLGSQLFVMPIWLRASLSAFIIVGLIILNLTTKRQATLLSFKKATPLDYLIASISILICGAILFIALLKGPDLTLNTRNQIVQTFVPPTAPSPTEPTNSPINQNPLKSPTLNHPHSPHHNEGSSIQIPKRTDLPLTEFPEVYLEPLTQRSQKYFSNQENYLLSRTMTKFDGLSWDFDNLNLQFKRANSNGWVQLTTEQNTEPYHYKIHRHKKFKLLLTAQGVEKVKLPYLRSTGNAKYILPPPTDDKPIRQYEAYSSPKNFRDILKSDTKEITVGKINNRYTKIGFTGVLREKIVREVRKLRPSKGHYNQLIALQYYLSKNCKYSLKVENPGNHNPIDNFLFHERKGSCLHYATVTTLFCRELGIPARMSIGYAGGKYFPHKNWHVFYTRNLHAWTEIYLQDYGWVIFDTSPPQAQRAEIASATDTLQEIPKSGNAPSKDDLINNLTTPSSADEQQRLNQSLAQIKWMLVIIAGLTTLLIACCLWQKKTDRKRSQQENANDERRNHQDKPYIKLFKITCQLNGKPMMDSDTLRHHTEKLANSDTPPEFSQDLLHYHYQTTYQQQPPNKKIEAQLMKRIKKWKL